MTTPVLDPCCGPKMMWFDKNDARVTFGDIREESTELCDGRMLTVSPDQVMDFRAIPFPDETFWHVVFDPPHLKSLGKKSWTAAKYGALLPTWHEDIAEGFSECFRVLKPHGTLIFKWNEDQIPVSDILALTPHKPLYGHRSGRLSKTHWIAFIKDTATLAQNSVILGQLELFGSEVE